MRRFLTLFADYIGGYILEDKTGNILTMPYSYAKITEPTVMIDSALDIDAGTLETYLRDGLVRNVITMSHVGVTRASEQDLATVQIVLAGGIPEVIYTAHGASTAQRWLSIGLPPLQTLSRARAVRAYCR